MRVVSFLLIFSYLVGCGTEVPEERASTQDTGDNYTPQEPTIFSGDISFLKTVTNGSQTYDGKNLFAQNVSSGYTFSLSNNPANITIDSSTGVISLNNASSSPGLYSGLVLTADETAGSNDLSTTFSIAVNGDPLVEHAWHIENTAQKTFMLVGGVAGNDLNVLEVFQEGITGDGVRVAISDSGVEIAHDDLASNALTGEHRDYSLSSPYVGDPTPTSAHGTAVTGIINAVGWNNFGSMGVAPGAKFAGFQFLESAQSTSLLVNQASGNFDIFNYSYGDAIFQDTLSDSTYIDHLKFQTVTENKVFVKAAGNEYLLGVGTTCASHNANFPFENDSPYIMVIGAMNADGAKATYSNQGSNLWVTAPGGEGSVKSFEPRILTTDLPTCFKGYSKAVSGLENDFEYGHPLNEQCHYTSVMNGTSSAAPMVSGVIALMREANSSLKQRDIKHILANTSVKIDPDYLLNDFGKIHPSNLLSGCTPLNLSGHEYEQGWVTNAAGYDFSNFYGFGLVDAKAAVDMAKVYTFPLGTLVEQNAAFNVSKFSSGTLNTTIPNNSATGVTDTINIASGDNLTVESVQVKVRAGHGASGQLGVELTSPAGTKSILMNINNSFLLLDTDDNGTIEGDSDLNIVLTSHAFYGESSQGNWTIKLIDGGAGITGTLTDWNINILGHN